LDLHRRTHGIVSAPVLVLTDITKRFGALIALDRASLSAAQGTVHALLGENGAGKTTLMRVAFGMTRPDSGTVAVEGVERRFASPTDAIRAGIGMVHQHFALVGAMSVAENVALGSRGRYRASAAAARVRRLSDDTGLSLDPDARVDSLSVEGQQRVEVMKALARDARILVLDEPTAVLPPARAAELLQWLRRFADSGRTVVLITHNLREALSVADDVTVLRRGRTVLEAGARMIDEDRLAAAMLGESRGSPSALGEGVRARGLQSDVPVLIADHISIADSRGAMMIRDASFTVSAGEIVGIAAVEGAGQHELLRALAGRARASGGALTISDGVGFVPEDRQRDGLVLNFTLYENVALRGAGRRRGRVRWRLMRAHTATLIAAHDIRAGSVASLASALSGGNQQKLVLARELDDNPRAVVAENPTRGLDIQATAAIHMRLRAARDSGAAVVLYSSDIDEMLTLADRVLVVVQGRVREVVHDREIVGRTMLGAA
jgi:general nucleoside transport system ATP-binding protein